MADDSRLRPQRRVCAETVGKRRTVGRMLVGRLGVFSEFERAMIRDRVLAGLDRARSSGKRLGKPRTTPFQVQRIRLALDEGRGVRETARLLKISAAKVSEVRRMTAAMIDLHP